MDKNTTIVLGIAALGTALYFMKRKAGSSEDKKKSGGGGGGGRGGGGGFWSNPILPWNTVQPTTVNVSLTKQEVAETAQQEEIDPATTQVQTANRNAPIQRNSPTPPAPTPSAPAPKMAAVSRNFDGDIEDPSEFNGFLD
jgi:hypothetical protein